MSPAIRFVRAVGAGALLALPLGAVAAPPRADTGSPLYPYNRTGDFAAFVSDSFRAAKTPLPDRAATTFFTYMGAAIPKRMDMAKPKLDAAKTVTERAAAERTLCAELHKAIKKQIPRFSLDRGFEFYQTVKLGERQCFLQSVVIASLLQRAGLPAGVVMVSRNEKGAYCNNGHAVVVARIADGTDILVDASDPQPFMTHGGLMVRVPSLGGYAYVAPVYDAAHRITAYKTLRGGGTLAPAKVATLDTAFLRSQFDYYRGERTPGGLFTPLGTAMATPAGLAKSEHWLQKSVSECPQNPLAVYMLGKVQERQNEIAPAKRAYSDAYALYSRYGWVPNEMDRALAEIKHKAARVAKNP